jgi:small subunit ribosomal protein S1
MGTPQPFHILNMDRSRSNIVVSRRAVLEESRSEARDELVDDLKEGQIREGVVKNITDYGAFIDLGGVDGLLHVTDLAWRRVNHPSDVLSIGQSVEVQVIRFDKEKERISLGMKQLQQDPWEQVQENYPVGGKFTGRVTNITDYGAFVALEPGVEGLVHVSEMSWTNKNVHPSKVVSTSQEVEVAILDVDTERRRISLGIKQTRENPWISFANEHPPGSEITGTVKNITEFGMFVGLPEDIDGMVHLSDLSWELDGEQAVKDYNVGDEVKVKILDVDTDRERVSLGIKQLEDDPFAEAIEGISQNDVITVVVNKVQDDGIEVTVKDDVTGWIPKHELARERAEQRPDRFAVGDKVDARITNIDRRNRKISLSIKKREIAEEKEAMQKYGSKDSGASLGDILGQALGGAEATESAQEKLIEAEAEESSEQEEEAPETEAEDEEEKAEAEEDEVEEETEKTSDKSDKEDDEKSETAEDNDGDEKEKE